MTRQIDAPAKRPRISIDVDPARRCRLLLAAARRDQSVRAYVLQAIQDRRRHEKEGAAEVTALTAASDPVLAELWDNDRDAAYDRL